MIRTSLLTSTVGRPHRRSHARGSITPREYEVLYLIAYEYSTKQIASKLQVSYETASTHRQNLKRKLGVRNTAGMIRVAFEIGLLVPKKQSLS